MLKLSCIEVCLKSWLRTIWGSHPRLSSMTMRMPSRSLSSRTSLISSMTLLFTSSAMRLIRFDLLTW